MTKVTISSNLRFSVLLIFGAIFAQLSIPQVSAQVTPSGLRLKDINPDVLIGATLQSNNIDTEHILTDNHAKQNIFKREFNIGQATCYPAWFTWTGLKQYDFTQFNNSVNWLYNNNFAIVAHLLAGPDRYYPDWFKNTSYSKAQLEDILEDNIRATITSNGNANKVDYWNVVNEALIWNGNYYDNDSDVKCKFQNMGYEADKSGLADKVHTQHPIYIRKAFEYARKYTNKKLELRDNSAEFENSGNVNRDRKAKAFYQLVKHLVNSGVPIDAVGLQGHFKLDKTYVWDDLKLTIQKYKDLDLEVYLTEVDYADEFIDVNKDGIDDGPWTPEKAQIQKQEYKSMIQAAAEGGVKWICFWGIRDNFNINWLYNRDPMLFAEDLTTKPAYYGVQAGLRLDYPNNPNWSTTIQAEHYVNSIGVNTQPAKDFGGGLNVGWTDAGDYMAYTNNVISIPSAGQYTVEYRVASPVNTGVIELRRTGSNPPIYGRINVPNTGGFQTWRTIKHTVTFPQGSQTFRIQVINGGFNVNWFRITKVNNTSSPSAIKGDLQTDVNTIPELNEESNIVVRNNILNLKLSGQSSNVRLYSLDGKKLVDFPTYATEAIVDMNKYRTGVYILKVSSPGGNLTKKVIRK